MGELRTANSNPVFLYRAMKFARLGQLVGSSDSSWLLSTTWHAGVELASLPYSDMSKTHTTADRDCPRRYRDPSRRDPATWEVFATGPATAPVGSSNRFDAGQCPKYAGPNSARSERMCTVVHTQMFLDRM